jgi:polysaccharide export outer membrane protein
MRETKLRDPLMILCAVLVLLTLTGGCRSRFWRLSHLGDEPSPAYEVVEATNQAGCVATTNPIIAPASNAPVTPAVPQPATEPLAATGKAAGTGAAKVRAGLTVAVQVLVLGKKEIDEQNKRIADDGTLVLPMVGSVRAEGLTVGQLADELTRRYGEYFRDPQVVVDYVMEKGGDAASPWGYVTVLGRVKNPGRVKIPPTRDLTVSAAVQQAGGFEKSAKDSGIRVSRPRDDGTSETLEVDLRAVGARGAAVNDLILNPGDVVFVPEMIF